MIKKINGLNNNESSNWEEHELELLGLGKSSSRKSYYPELQKTISKLKHANGFISDILNSMRSAMICVDESHRITFWNKHAEVLFSENIDQVNGKKLEEVIERLHHLGSLIDQAIETQCEQKINHEKSYSSSGDFIYEDITISPMTESKSSGVVIRIDDVSKSFKMQEALARAERMVSLGGIAAGMAHEINNPIAGIIQTAAVIHNRLESQQIPANIEAAKETGLSLSTLQDYMRRREIPSMFENISNAGEHIANVVENMLSFSNQRRSANIPRSPEAIVDQSIALLGCEYNNNEFSNFRDIEIKKEYSENIPKIPCDQSKIQQVLMNLLRNSGQALDAKKATESNFVPQITVRVSLDDDSQWVNLEIEDNGPGMDEESKKRLFEPFYTTKEPGQGTGLGLSISYFIIKEDQLGDLLVESDEGKGTKFIIKLPVKREQDLDLP